MRTNFKNYFEERLGSSLFQELILAFKFIFIALIFIITFLLWAKTTSAQTTFQRLYHQNIADEALSVEQLNDGNFVVSGTGAGFILLKTTSNGTIQWFKTYGGSDVDFGGYMTKTTDGGFALIGTTLSFGAGGSDIFVIKVNSAGVLQWARTYGGSGWDDGYAISTTADGNLLIGGAVAHGSSNIPDFFVAKIKGNNGDSIWTKTYNSGLQNGYDECRAIKETSSGEIIACGRAVSWRNGGYNSDILLLKLDQSGNKLWQKFFGGNGLDVCNNFIEDDDGFVFTGSSYFDNSTQDSTNVFLFKTNFSGGVFWSRFYSNNDNCGGFHLSKINSDLSVVGLIHQADYNDNLFVLKTDNNGDLLQQKFYGNNAHDYAKSVKVTNDGGLIIAGMSDYYGTGNQDFYLLKTDSLGQSNCSEQNMQMYSYDANFNETDFYYTEVAWQCTTNVVTSQVTTLSGGSQTLICLQVNEPEIAELSSEIKFSPNPFKEKVKIQTSQKEKIIIFDLLGKEIKNFEVFGEKEIFLPKGIYFWKSEKKSGKLISD